MNNNPCIIHGGYPYCFVYLQRISDTPCSISNEYPSEPKHLSELVWDCCKCWPTVPDAPKLITTTLMVLLYQSPEILVTPKVGWNTLLQSDFLLNLTLLSFHSASSHTLLAAPSHENTFCWCAAIDSGNFVGTFIICSSQDWDSRNSCICSSLYVWCAVMLWEQEMEVVTYYHISETITKSELPLDSNSAVIRALT